MSDQAIRTFTPGRGRMRARRREAMAQLAPRYGVAVAGDRLDLPALFGRTVPVVLEIGSGMGDATAALAAADPDRDYLAAEVHPPGVANLLRLVEEHRLTNLRVAHGDALTLLRERLAPGALVAVHAFFPDPWPKLRHHKRRLFRPDHVALIRSRLAPGGVVHAATDWPDYARVIRDTLAADPELVPAAPASPPRPRTKYERRALAAGRRVTDLLYRRTAPGGPVTPGGPAPPAAACG